MKIIIILTLFFFYGCSHPIKKLNIENTIWGFNNGYFSYLLILEKEGIAKLLHTSDKGPTKSSRKGTYKIKDKLLTITFPKSKVHNSPAFQKELIVYNNPNKQPYLAGPDTYKLKYISKYPPSEGLTNPITN